MGIFITRATPFKTLKEAKEFAHKEGPHPEDCRCGKSHDVLSASVEYNKGTGAYEVRFCVRD